MICVATMPPLTMGMYTRALCMPISGATASTETTATSMATFS